MNIPHRSIEVIYLNQSLLPDSTRFYVELLNSRDVGECIPQLQLGAFILKALAVSIKYSWRFFLSRRLLVNVTMKLPVKVHFIGQKSLALITETTLTMNIISLNTQLTNNHGKPASVVSFFVIIGSLICTAYYNPSRA